VASGNGKERPTSLDYFRADGPYSKLFLKELGPTPRVLPILFLSDNVQECCYERYELRKGSKLYARGDGENFEVWNAQAEEYVPVTKTQEPGLGKRLAIEAGENGKPAEWQTILTLRFLILPLKSVWGCWSFSTKGEASSIPAIIAAFDAVKNIARTVVGVPFDLTVEMVKSQKPGSESRFPVVKLVPNVGEEHLQMLGELKEQGRTFHKVLTADAIEKEVKSLPAPEATHGT
jgi:hypothetical protein